MAQGSQPEPLPARAAASTLGSLFRARARIDRDMAAVIDLVTARPGQRLFHITPGQVNVPYGVEIVQVGPSTLTMEFELSGIRQVPVEPNVDGRPAPGYEVIKITSDPATVEVAGPESALKRLQAAITEPVSVVDQTRTVREVVNIGVPNATLRLRMPQTAVVTVTISPKQP